MWARIASSISLLTLGAGFFAISHALELRTRSERLPPNITVGAEDVIRIRASTDESKSTFVEWIGQTLIYKPGQTPSVAFNVVGMNVARAKKLEDGSYDILAKEIQLYLDPKTNAILHTWTNPFTSENVNVIHVQNSPVYQTIPTTTAYTARSLPNNYYTFAFNIPLAYPNPLNPTNDPNSPFRPYQGSYQALYSAIESFAFTFPSSELANRKLEGLPSSQIYWTRTSPLLPWMNSPDTNATLLFIADGNKVSRGWKGLSPILRGVIEDTLPGYKEAPLNRTRPGGGVTSWSFFTQPDVFAAWKNGMEFPVPET
ncbi:hypothetical protein BDV96DRAFT_655866 [Lophiotrema nucula]|uniref:DUF1838 domain-containing protein n=1 Tax=Lophiotrema nucula TaxID=690887 RepID=A0A6A5YFW9_9PLEO|nr:hypothetical protein BDV96DRAFT_655866 [Lophiotrema nucula]